MSLREGHFVELGISHARCRRIRNIEMMSSSNYLTFASSTSGIQPLRVERARIHIQHEVCYKFARLYLPSLSDSVTTNFTENAPSTKRVQGAQKTITGRWD